MTDAIRVAVLDDQVPAQLRERPDDAQGLDVVWSGTSFDDLLRFTGQGAVQVVVADLDRLGADPVAASEQLLASSAADLLITLYRFAPREVVDRLGGPRRRVVRVPVSVPLLKLQMMSTIVKGLLAEAPRPPSALPPRPALGPRVHESSLDAPRYTDVQLGTLRERKSRLACECPNHVAELVSSLVAFERYSKACANRDEDDAAMHRALATATAQARRVMEDALTNLLRFEKIEV
jgi:hypothetical protein